jgi:hypothetical protein
MSIAAVNMPKYATVLNGGVAKLGDGSLTVGATALGVDGSADNAKVCYTAGAYGGIVESLMASTNDTVAVNLFVYGLDGATVHPFGLVNIPLSSGNALSVPNVDVINGLVGLPKNAVGVKYIPLRANMTLKVAVLAAMTAQKILTVKATGVDFVA